MDLLHASVHQFVVGPLVDVPLGVHLLLVRQRIHLHNMQIDNYYYSTPYCLVDLVNEDFEADSVVDPVRLDHVLVETLQRLVHLVLIKESVSQSRDVGKDF